ncbi:MAG: ABC transporter ATP-binding protein, partial [Methanomassiliicoccales archaeon]|nr:ABC transporter ATP-binding protein [Methanomassiliicoccales archaeon]
ITDNMMTGIPLDEVGRYGIIMLIIYAISAVLMLAQGIILATVTQRTAGNLRKDISRKINRIPLSFFDKTSTGDIMSRVTNDADTMGQSMNQAIGMLVSSITLFIGSIVMMTITNVLMMITAVVSSLAGIGLMIIIMTRSQKYFNKQQNDLGQMNGHIAETYGAHNIVKAYNGEEQATERFEEINGSLAKSAFFSQFLSGLMMPLMNFVGNFGYVAVCVVGAVLVIDGRTDIGTIVAFMIYIRLFTQPLAQMSQAFTNMQSVAAGSERVFEFLETEELADESSLTEHISAKGKVEFKDVHFGYVEGEETIHGFSASVEPGQKIAIVGPTGAGKTTMVNLLMKFYDINSGDILLDGVSIKKIPREDVHRQFCMVLQDTWLFEGTIKENIVYCRENISDEDVVEACKAVGIHHFITTLPNGYDTVLGSTATLSAGQRQQLTIARAMIDKSPLLILDEATSSVDTRTERTIQEAMDRLSQNRTSFVIAHRLSTIKNSDLILVMNEGSIIEQGTHEELLAKGGFYEKLYNSQFEETEE